MNITLFLICTLLFHKGLYLNLCSENGDTKTLKKNISWNNFSGGAFADTSLLAASEFSAQQPLDNSGYYDTYPSAAGYDYDAGYQVQDQGEQERWGQTAFLYF